MKKISNQNMNKTYAKRIHEKITSAFAPCELSLADESHKHTGHSGHHPSGETHFFLTIISDSFKGMKPVQRHQAVYSVLKEELNERVHALRLRTLTQDES